MDERTEMVKCLLCNGSMPASDFDTQVEHMFVRHGAKDDEEAINMARENFVRIRQT